MKQDIEGDMLIKSYLLGNLRQEEKLQVEERLFFDRDYFQVLQAVEDDLIDDYVYGELSTDEREKFENYFLSTHERHEALRVAQALKSYISTNPVSSPVTGDVQRSKLSFLQSLRLPNLLWKQPLAVATLLLIFGGAWLLMRVVRTPDQTRPIQEAQQSPQQGVNQNSSQQNDEQSARDTNLNMEPQNKQEQYAGQQNREPSGSGRGKEREPIRPQQRDNRINSPGSQSRLPATHVYAFLLIPGGPTRGDDDSNKVNLPADAGIVNLQLPLLEDVDYRNFQALLYSDDNKVIRMWNGLNPTNSKAGKIVSIRVPAELLQKQKYHVELKGVSLNGDLKEVYTYYFRVSKR